MWANPRAAALMQTGAVKLDEQALNDDFDDFYEEVFDEISKIGEIESLNVAGNTTDHMIGCVYVKFNDEEDAQAAIEALTGRYYAGRPLKAEYSPVTDFREARCRQFDENKCNRGGLCNFLHLIQPHWRLKEELQRKQRKQRRERERERSRSRSRDKGKDRSRSPDMKASRERERR